MKSALPLAVGCQRLNLFRGVLMGFAGQAFEKARAWLHKVTAPEDVDHCAGDRITGMALLNERVALVEKDVSRPVCSSVVLKEGDYHAFVTETLDVEPQGSVTWYMSGPAGATVSISLERVANSGGHNHPNNSSRGPEGTVTPTSMVLGPNYPQSQPCVYRAPHASGTVKIISRFSTGGVEEDFNRVAVPNLVAFAGGVGIVLVGATSTHPDNHYGLPALNGRLADLGRRFHARFARNLFVNDMSLVGGGLFDIHGRWASPHQTHRDGRRVDINSTSMSEEERDFFREAARAAGFRAVVLETSPEHWHLEI